ncbi:DUF6461 domain-containing protein [Streptomyces poriferorum]|uniref:DUF6461 domain-containing protein n=1 Tax=Streptomyces poriferorum TaxID=2798799 RepID=A0ABY9IG66_9ACTN|nr:MULTISPECIES: DUF6461 domain-containing protein [unclassified Streptomyces]MDP5315851.1 DUF6461 domain-containing protein [Streptomyces sp. Alt4]WLQ53034.1 DUF6461 domain-containing protein [Streptomyces sp. Alt1]WLQ54203.1 DUF6461 domain-containing protein [Streptomyces sp. Alt2]
MVWEDLVAGYAWADAADWETYTFSVVRGKTEEEVIRAFGGDPASSRAMTFAEAADEQADHIHADHALLRVVTVEKHVVAIEWGSHGSIPEIARLASSDGGEFFSVHHNVLAQHQVMHARDGRVDGMFDPSVVGDAAWMEPTPENPAWAAGIPFQLDTQGSESFALLERIMGVQVVPAWMDTALRTVPLTSPDALFSDLEAAWLP